MAAPGDHEVAVGVAGDRRVILLSDKERVDHELGADGRPRAREPLREHTEARALLVGALPDDDEVSVGLDGHVGEGLGGHRVRIDLELGGERHAGAREPTSEDAVVRAVLEVARPGDDEGPIRARRHRRQALVLRGVGVDLELDAQADHLGRDNNGKSERNEEATDRRPTRRDMYWIVRCARASRGRSTRESGEIGLDRRRVTARATGADRAADQVLPRKPNM